MQWRMRPALHKSTYRSQQELGQVSQLFDAHKLLPVDLVLVMMDRSVQFVIHCRFNENLKLQRSE